MKETRFAFCDLDDMLFQSRRKSQGDDLQPVVFLSNGTPVSFQTPQQRALYNLLAATTRLIPTTGRSSKWMERVKLAFTDYAICSFGGVILTPQRLPEPRWYELVRQQAQMCQRQLAQIQEYTEAEAARLSVAVRVKAACDQGLELYVSVKHRQRDAGELSRLAQSVQLKLEPGWWLHVNGKNMAICPPFLGKEKAVAWFLSELAGPHTLVVGLGDSFSDVGFLSVCDFAASPVDSQIFGRLAFAAR